MAYKRTNWKSGAEGGTIVSDERLNNIEDGIQQALAGVPDVALPDAVMTAVAAEPTSQFAILQNATFAPKRFGYLLACFRGDSLARSSLNLYYSGDGVSFISSGKNPVYVPVDGTSYVRDPSIIYKDGFFYVAHTNSYGTGTSFDVVRSADLLKWSKMATVDVASIGSVTKTWAPELIVDGDDVYVFISINATDPYWLKATSADLSTWTAPTLLTITGRPASLIDPDFIKRDNTWYCYYKDEGSDGISRATSTSLTGTFATDRTGDWAGWGTGVEGPSIVQLGDGTYRIYMDRITAGTGIAYSDSPDMETWAPLTGLTVTPALSGTDLLRHGSVLAVEDAKASGVINAFHGLRIARNQFLTTGTPHVITSATMAAVDTALDLKVPARVGDIIEVLVAGQWSAEAAQGFLNVRTITDAGTPINSFAHQGVGDNYGSIPGCTGEAGVITHFSGGTAWVATTADVIGGMVRLRLYARSTGSKTLYASSNNARMYFRASNLGAAVS